MKKLNYLCNKSSTKQGSSFLHFSFFLASACTFFYILSQPANAVLVENANIKEGKASYDINCKSCHGRNLEGSVGFNLVDGESVHGNSVEAIAVSISEGFSDKGMPAFKHTLAPQDIANLTAYILSKRLGFEDLSYKVWPISTDPSLKISTLNLAEPLKTGKLKQDNLMDFTFTELNDFAIEFEGILHTPTDQETVLQAHMSNRIQVQVWLNDELQENVSPAWLNWVWPLNKGKQKVRIRYITTGTRTQNDKDLQFFVADNTSIIKLFPVSMSAKRLLEDRKYMKQTPGLVERKRMAMLPPYSLVIGTGSNLNFAFNTKTCSIVGAWLGSELNIGPNIFGRGRAGSEINGVWVFKYPQQISVEDTSTCRYQKYTRGASPKVFYSLQGNNYELSAVTNDKSFTLQQRLLSKTESKQVTFTLTDELKDKVKIFANASNEGLTTNIEVDLSGIEF